MKGKYLIFFLLFAFLFIACPLPPVIDPPDPPIDPPIEYVERFICLDSGVLIHIYCPSERIVKKKFVKGTEPLTWCSFHKKPIPPIPEPSEPYVGASFYQLQTESSENIKWFISQLREHGANMTEIFLTFTWSNGWKHSPFKQVGTWSEEKFGDYQFPTFDLNQWNPQTWETLKLIFSECKANGIALSIRVHDYCSIKDGFEKRHNPFNKGSNIQEWTGGFWGESIQHWYSKLNKKLIETINEVGLKHYFIVPMNESDVVGDDSDEWKDEACLDYHKFMIADFKILGVKSDQFILNIFRENTFEYFKDLDYRMEHHGIASPQALNNIYQSEGDNIFPNGDGPDPFALGHTNFKGYREPSYNQGVEMGKMKPGFYCHSERLTEQTEIADVRKAVFIALDGLVEGLKK